MAVLALMSGCGASGGEWDSQPQPAGILEVPFGFERNQIALDVEMHGTGPFRMLLDTGVDPSAVDLSTALKVGIPVDLDSAGVAEGVGNERPSVYSATIKSLRVGGWAFGDVPAAAFSMEGLSEAFGRPLHGVLGYSFLQGKVLQIDYAERLVRIVLDDRSAREAFSIPADAYRLPLEFVDEGVLIPRIAELRVNGRVIPVSLDTGSSLTVELFAGVVAELGLEQAVADARSASVRGARGQAAVKVLQFDSVGLGPLTVSPLEGRVADRAGDRNTRLGNLGNGFLQNFVLTLDYREGEVFFELPESAVTAETPAPEGPVPPRPRTEGESRGS
jgi:predicted aspartyl protease